MNVLTQLKRLEGWLFPKDPLFDEIDPDKRLELMKPLLGNAPLFVQFLLFYPKLDSVQKHEYLDWMAAYHAKVKRQKTAAQK